MASEAAFCKAAPLHDPPVQPVDVPFEGTRWPAYLWRPDEAAAPGRRWCRRRQRRHRRRGLLLHDRLGGGRPAATTSPIRARSRASCCSTRHTSTSSSTRRPRPSPTWSRPAGRSPGCTSGTPRSVPPGQSERRRRRGAARAGRIPGAPSPPSPRAGAQALPRPPPSPSSRPRHRPGSASFRCVVSATHAPPRKRDLCAVMDPLRTTDTVARPRR